MNGIRKAGQVAPKINPHKGVIERARQFRKVPKPATVPDRVNRPDALGVKDGWVEVPIDPKVHAHFTKMLTITRSMGAEIQSWSIRQFKYGELNGILTRQEGRLHLSVSHPRRLPTWDEVSGLWYNTIAKNGEVGALLLPKPEQFVNIHKYVLQIKEIPQSLAAEYED